MFKTISKILHGYFHINAIHRLKHVFWVLTEPQYVSLAVPVTPYRSKVHHTSRSKEEHAMNRFLMKGMLTGLANTIHCLFIFYTMLSNCVFKKSIVHACLLDIVATGFNCVLCLCSKKYYPATLWSVYVRKLRFSNDSIHFTATTTTD